MLDRRALVAGTVMLPLLAAASRAGPVLAVRDFGARGDGRTLDTAAINAAIAEAARRGGGTVHFVAGRYLSFSIRLQSNVTLLLGPGAVIEAADPARHPGAYDPPEPNPHDVYQDFGHSHWRNSLIWGDGVHDVAILGPGRIEGVGLTRNGPGARWTKAGGRPVSMDGMATTAIGELEPARQRMVGRGNKAIALKNARNIRLDGFTILKGGHFAILLTGCSDVAIAGLAIDTDRDGIDIDACRNVVVRDTRVNSPNDDGIVLKASLALGRPVATEDVVVRDCAVSGFDLGTMLDGTRRRTQELSPDRDRVTGRIKLGTESNGGYRRVQIRDCTFERSRGLALETVDGGVLEDVTVRGLVLREVTTAPIFLRTGDRRRGPEGTPVGRIRRVAISEVEATGIDPRYAASIVGLPDSPVADVRMRDLRLVYAGGGTAADATRAVPEMRDSYPEPSMFGTLPAYGLYVRHARDIRIDGLDIRVERSDGRPPIVVEDGDRIAIRRLRASGTEQVRASRAVTIGR